MTPAKVGTDVKESELEELVPDEGPRPAGRKPVECERPRAVAPPPGREGGTGPATVAAPGGTTIRPPAAYAPPPIKLEEGEELLEYKKPRPFAYAPLLFGTLFGAVLFLLFLASMNVAGIIFGIAILGGLYYVLRYRYYNRVGYWFTSGRIIVDDGTRIQMVPYDEIALSSLAFEQDSVLFSTIYNKELILRGVGDSEAIVRFLSKRGKELKKG
jgi:hypothetical protein